MIPDPPAPDAIAVALGERLGRPVSLAEIGMCGVPDDGPEMGLDFPRDPADAVRGAASFWSTVHRREFLGGAFAVAAYTTPVTRWLVQPDARLHGHRGGRQVGRADLDELWAASSDARSWDSRYGGGSWKSSSVAECLRLRATPLLSGTYQDQIGTELFCVTAELARVVGWSALDMGQHDAAQRHFIQALALARAAGDTGVGCHVLTTMALQALLRGFSGEAIDMTQGAFERARSSASPRVLAFAKMVEARAHGRARDPRAAARALAEAETQLGRGWPDPDPEWISYMTHTRLSSDAVEVWRDLGKPKVAFGWNKHADAMPTGSFARSVGLRLTVLGTTHLQAGELEQGLAMGDRAVEILSRVQSTRARDYVRQYTTALRPWSREPEVRDLLHRARTRLAAAS
ncbi:sporulation protein [Streptacidiphilus neutrinimicus]|uniref:sporulation protein n=1 Tax=Streptacidiphilus neutrinimicus TaxID=105420 RepID=UPI001F164189|nr:sporulation protein [Streptacidiphilus neutrinimicus]